jgi:hypothetical protein
MNLKAYHAFSVTTAHTHGLTIETVLPVSPTSAGGLDTDRKPTINEKTTLQGGENGVKYLGKLTENRKEVAMGNTARHLYSGGCRARKSGVEYWLQWPDDNRRYPTSVQTWEELRVYEVSITWKERHANGTPVKMTMGEYGSYVPGKTDPSHWYGLTKYVDGEPYIECVDLNFTRLPHIATFCNFRYKQSWLEKKGGNDGR